MRLRTQVFTVGVEGFSTRTRTCLGEVEGLGFGRMEFGLQASGVWVRGSSAGQFLKV